MLIAQVFPVVSVYTLPGGQHAYRENIINFSQDVREFMARLSRDPSLLDLLIVQRYSDGISGRHSKTYYIFFGCIYVTQISVIYQGIFTSYK